MHNFISKILFPNKYENGIYLENYIKCHYGPFFKEHQFTLSEDFYQTLLLESSAFIDQESTVLDIGSATGRLVFEFEKMGARTSIGIDTSNSFIEFCNLFKENGAPEIDFRPLSPSRAEFICTDILKAPVTEYSFDFISCINVIDRVEDPQEFVDALYTMLKPNGVLLLVDPYDWGNSPAPESKYTSDMKSLLDEKKWQHEKEMQDITYTVPIHSSKNRTYKCHLVVARKI